jgi:hypothetical protein
MISQNVHVLLVYGQAIILWSLCKSWTLDSRMDCGMEYGLDCGL